MYRMLKKTTLGLVGLVLLAAFGIAPPAGAAGVPESDEPIKLAINEWTGQHITTRIAGELLKKMGYNVEYVTAGYYPQLVARTRRSKPQQRGLTQVLRRPVEITSSKSNSPKLQPICPDPRV